MENEKIKKLKEDYPNEFFKVTQKEGKVVINERKVVLWMPKRVTAEVADSTPQQLSNYLEELLEHIDINSDYFGIEQKLVTLKCSRLIADKAKECSCTKIALLAALFEYAEKGDK